MRSWCVSARSDHHEKLRARIIDTYGATQADYTVTLSELTI
jgi:hypothetical protein